MNILELSYLLLRLEQALQNLGSAEVTQHSLCTSLERQLRIKAKEIERRNRQCQVKSQMTYLFLKSRQLS